MRFRITVLGSGSALPAAGRHHSAQAVNVHEQHYLVDCGEGTQSRLVQYGINPMKIKAVFITHLHGDHIYGLFPLISSLELMGRKTPLQVYAPHPLGELMEKMTGLAGEAPPFEVEFHPVDTTRHLCVYENTTLEVWSVPLRHRIPAAGYLFREKSPAPNVRKEAIESYGLTIPQILAAKRGEDITAESGRIIPASDITYAPYRARSYAYISDTLRSGKVARLVSGVDVLYHEATFADDEKTLAAQTGHTTASQAAKVASDAGAGRLLIGHFSGRYKEVEPLVEQARAIFPATEAAEEGASYEIPLIR